MKALIGKTYRRQVGLAAPEKISRNAYLFLCFKEKLKYVEIPYGKKAIYNI